MRDNEDRRMSTLPSDLQTMDKLDYDLAAGEVDVRGYDLYDRDEKKIGTIENLLGSPSQSRAYCAVVNAGGWLDDRRIVVPLGHLGVDQPRKRVYVGFTRDQFRDAPAYDESNTDISRYNAYWDSLPTGKAAGMTGTEAIPQRPMGEVRVPEIEETVEVRKVAHQTGSIGLRKRVETETEHLSTPVTRTRVVAERRDVAPGEAVAADPNATTLREGETLRVPIVEEEVVVEKVPRVTGEVILRTETETERVEQDVELRRERVEIEEDTEEAEELEPVRDRNR